MFVQMRQKLLLNIVAKYGKQTKCSLSTVSEIKTETENKIEPVYPPIQDISTKAKKKKTYEEWHDKIKCLETVEEKQIKINMPRYYGWKLLLLKEHHVPYNSLSHAQYITRTHVVQEPGLPTYYNNVISNEQLDSIVQQVKTSIEDNILFEYCSRRRNHEVNNDDLECKDKMENILSKALIQNINRTILIHLSSKYPHLLHTQVDFDPRLEASWFVGGINPIHAVKQYRKRYKSTRDHINDPVEIPVQYLGQPVIHMRHKHPLKQIISLSECENPALNVPEYKMYPKVLNYLFDRRHMTNIPGFWPGDQNEFGLLSYHNCAYLLNRLKEYNDTSSALTTQAIFASYSWLLSQACYQGFTTFNEITYPLINQAVITNGQWWSFFVYQLNTVLLHSEHADVNPKRNVCWMTKPMKLFDKIENENIYGLNEEVIKTLIKFYVNTPEERIDVDLKPYLGESVKLVADIEHDKRRIWLEQRYKHLFTNRPRHKRIPQIYHWQKIYLIDHKTRPMDKKREPWQYGINIFKRRLDDHLPPYIPRCLRENPKRRKIGRWEKTYYP